MNKLEKARNSINSYYVNNYKLSFEICWRKVTGIANLSFLFKEIDSTQSNPNTESNSSNKNNSLMQNLG